MARVVWAVFGPEAFLRGLPVVAFDSGGIGDWLEDGVTGHPVTSGDSLALGHCLELLLESPALRFEMGQRAAKNSGWAGLADLCTLE